MLPYFIIGICALIGLLKWGLPGLLIGGASGYVITMLLGVVSGWIIGGLVPRKVKRNVAVNLIANQHSIVEAAFPGLSGAQQLKVVENAIEYIFRTSHERDRSGSIDLLAPDRPDAIQKTVSFIIENEARPDMKTFYSALLHEIEKDMY